MFYLVLFLLLIGTASVLYFKYKDTDVLRRGRSKKRPCVSVDGEQHDEAVLSESAQGVLVNIEDFLEQYLIGDSLPNDVVMELQLKRLAGEEEACVSTSVLTSAQAKCSAYWKAQTCREMCIVLEEQARAKEEQGDIEGAIVLYEQNIESGQPTYYSFDRLISIYKERGEIEKEISVLKHAVLAFGQEHPLLRDICQLKLDKAIKRQKETAKLS